MDHLRQVEIARSVVAELAELVVPSSSTRPIAVGWAKVPP
jgi:hypothetical protein